MLPFTVLGMLERNISREERAKWSLVDCGGVFYRVLIVEIKIFNHITAFLHVTMRSEVGVGVRESSLHAMSQIIDCRSGDWRFHRG